MAEKERDSGFKVSDRRLFTADGELRTEVAEELFQVKMLAKRVLEDSP